MDTHLEGRNRMDRDENKKRAELLAPAGSYESLTAAIAAGADAVYVGGSMFGARAYANNFDTEELKKAINYVHLHGKNMYLTVNTLLKQDEIENYLYNYIEPLYYHGLDAVIVQDMGVLKFIRNYFPDLPIHASTQMTLTGQYGARLMEELGVTRMVTARELSFSEISKIHTGSNLEIESFIHGALCFCYSGQCLFSSLAGGRSGNRGRCAQPCRLPYEAFEGDKRIGDKNESYLLSPKDLCTIEILPEIIEAGVYSLKIEGRMKKPEYTAGVVSIYRKYLDLYLENGRENYKVDKNDSQKLFDLFNRGGFTQGYFDQHNGRDMLFLEGKDNKKQIRNEALFKEIQSEYLNKELKEIIKGKVRIYKEMPAIITLSFNDIEVEVTGGMVQAAKNQPMTEEKIRKQIEKTGNTGFVFEDLLIDTDNDSFIPVNSLNELRRLALEKLEKSILDKYRRNNAIPKVNILKEKKKSYKTSYPIHCYIEKKEYLEPLLEIDGIDGIYVDYSCIRPQELKSMVTACKKNGKSIYLVLPHIFRDKAEKWLSNNLDEYMKLDLDGFVVKNLEELEFLREHGCKKAFLFDYTMYGFNAYSKEQFEEFGVSYDTLSVELNARELEELSTENSELVVYGYLPMMVTAQCLHKTISGCDKKEVTLKLKDRLKNEFPVKNYCMFCYNKIYNFKPLSLLNVKKQVDRIAPRSVRLDFTLELIEDIAPIARKFVQVYKYNDQNVEELSDFTRGHFKRGVE